MQVEGEASKGKNLPNRYTVRRIGLGSFGKFGFVLGGLASLMPSLIICWTGLMLVGGLRRLLESWQNAGFHILGQRIGVDFVSLLNLEPLLRTAQRIDRFSWALAVLGVVVAPLVAGLVFLVMGSLVAWVYNFIAAISGGLEVELREVSRDKGPVPPSRIKG